MGELLPSGIVTFVLTDVVGSTRLWQDAPGEMATAIARHAEIIADAVSGHRGTMIKARGEGDSTFCVFGKATDAVIAAHEAQAALRTELWPGGIPLSVRFAVHTGEALERDDDYLGPVVNRAARLRSIALGGEVLVSGTTAGLVFDQLREDAALVELGDVRLRDLERVERIYALDAPGLATPRPGESRDVLAGGPDVDVRLLGPVQIIVDGELADTGGPKERAVLALLALAGGPLTIDQLIDALWDAEIPASARKTMQTYIWRLRKVLTEDVIATVTASYELRLRNETDVARFEHLAREGGESVVRGDAHHGSSLLAEALALWRGEPLSGCASSVAVAAERARLNEIHAIAIDRHLEAELQLGRHAQVLAELEALVRADPYREERWRMLVLALYRCGRQRDALRTYQRARHALIEGLGVEPGPALRDLEQAVLEQREDLSPGVPMRPAASSAIVEPPPGWRGISPPRPPTPLVGRSTEQDLIASMVDEHRLVTLTGPGGAGKTRLAIAVAELAGVPAVFCDLALLSRDGSVLHALSRALGQPVEPGGIRGEPDLLQRLVNATRDAEVVVVLDNCEHLLDACTEIVSRVLADCPGVQVLATSREPLGIPGEQVVTVEPLDVPTHDADVTASAVVLFEQRASAVNHGFAISATNMHAVIEISRRLEGLPLAIELAAARLTHLTPDDLVRLLGRPLEMLATRRRSGPGRHRTLSAALDWSHDLLDPAERTLFRRVGVFAGRFDLDDVHGCCRDGFEEHTVVDLLGALVDCSLVTADGSGPATQYRMLAPIRAYAREQLINSTEEAAVREAHCRWYLARVEDAPFGHRLLDAPTREMLATIQEDLRSALIWADTAGRHDLLARLVASMVGIWKEGHFAEADRWFPVAVDYESSLPPGERTATALASLMYLFHWDGDRTALRHHRFRLAALAENLPADGPVTALAYATLASICSRLHGEEAAWEAYAELALRHAPADAGPIVAMACCQKARALMFRDEAHRAIEVLNEAVAILGSEAERFEFSPQEDLALACHLVGDDVQTLAIAEARLTRDTPNPPWYVSIYAALACAALGEPARARGHVRAAADRARALTMPLVVNDCRVALGAIAFLEGRVTTASDLLAGLTTGSASYNTLGVLLRHYQMRAESAVSASAWERARNVTPAEALRLIEAELATEAVNDGSSRAGTRTPSPRLST